MIRERCPEEHSITLYLNGTGIATYQLTKSDLEDWTIGYLYSEGIIDSVSDIKMFSVNSVLGRINVELNDDFDMDVFLKREKHYTAGCGRGLTFLSMNDVSKFKRVKTNRVVKLSYLLKKRGEFACKSPLYIEFGGVHGAFIETPDGKITVREDIGRHNAVDKIIGYAIREGLCPEDLILITTGRISYEMLAKAAHFGIGIVGSTTAATDQAVRLASLLKIEVVGYIRAKMAIVYTKNGRVIDDIDRVKKELSFSK